MMPLPVDQEVRLRALDPQGSFHLEAPAGSGKTSVLLARFLTLLAQVETPEELLALTFTRKAAGELRTRVMQLLISKKDPGLEGHPWESLLQDLAAQVFRHFSRKKAALQEILAPERLPITTFHSFCAQLVRLAPQEAGVPLEFQLLEEREAAWLKQEALEELRRRWAARPSQEPVRQALVRRLVRLNNDWPRLAGELHRLLGRRDSLGEFLELARFSREAQAYQALLAERLGLLLPRLLESLAAGLGASELGRHWPGFWEAMQGAPLAAHLPSRLPGAAPADLPRWQAVAAVLLTKDGEPRRQLAPKYGFPPGLQQSPWPEVLQKLPRPVVRLLKQCRELHLTAASPEEVSALQDLVILLGEALTIYEELCAHRGALDFIALEQAALRLLTVDDPSDLLLRLDWRLTHLLVDEFQDTSEAQLTLLCRLLAGWETEAGRTLMVVGDPKQSIYGWRQAKLRLFQESRQGLPCSPTSSFPLEPLLLTTNFRATRTLIAWANGIFGDTVMAAAAAGEGVKFHAADPRPEAPEGEGPYLALFSGDDDRAARDREARWLALQVAQAAASRQEGETIGILLFTRTHLPIYLQALSDAGLAVKVREGLKLSDSLVVAHLHNLARALVRPQDEVAWAAALRGPWAPQSLATLVQVAQTPGELWPEMLGRFAGEGQGPQDFQQLVLSLSTARQHLGRRPLAEILQQVLEETAAWAGMACWEGAAGIANARAYLDLLHESEASLPEATFHKADFNLKEAFQPPDPRAQESPVEVLTVHGAKGLEFDVVFLPYLDWQPLKSEDKIPPFLLEEIPGTRLSGLALARAYAQEKQSSLYLLLRNLKEQRILDEARRVFYVAVTRARQRLVLSGVVAQDKQGKVASPGESPLRWLWQHYEPQGVTPGSPQTWSAPAMQVELVSAVPPLVAEEKESPELPRPWEFQGEAAPYRLEFPSQMVESLAEDAPYLGADKEAETARLRGVVIHRLLESLSHGREVPAAAAVAAALRQEGMAPEAADSLAPEILAEVAACQNDAFLAPLLNPGLPGAASEWLLEDAPAPGLIRRGVMDRLVCHDQVWWLLDYKTSRPGRGEDWEEFITREAEKYRPQLLAYREMAAKAKGVAPEALRVALYFTAIQRAVEV